jgi:hypothetical protein
VIEGQRFYCTRSVGRIMDVGRAVRGFTKR